MNNSFKKIFKLFKNPFTILNDEINFLKKQIDENDDLFMKIDKELCRINNNENFKMTRIRIISHDRYHRYNRHYKHINKRKVNEGKYSYAHIIDYIYTIENKLKKIENESKKKV